MVRHYPRNDRRAFDAMKLNTVDYASKYRCILEIMKSDATDKRPVSIGIYLGPFTERALEIFHYNLGSHEEGSCAAERA